jgi:hypothetical protein
MRAEDIIRILHFLQTDQMGFEKVTAMAMGHVGSEILHAAVFNDGIEKVCLVRPYLSFADIAFTREYSPDFIPSTVAGAIEAYDLADLMAALCPVKTLIINPRSGNGSAADTDTAGKQLNFPVDVYSRLDVSKNFSFACNRDKKQVVQDILGWLDR